MSILGSDNKIKQCTKLLVKVWFKKKKVAFKLFAVHQKIKMEANRGFSSVTD